MSAGRRRGLPPFCYDIIRLVLPVALVQWYDRIFLPGSFTANSKEVLAQQYTKS